MANWTIKNIALRGVTACVPNNKIDTKDMPIFTHEECEKFLEGVGIESRRVV